MLPFVEEEACLSLLVIIYRCDLGKFAVLCGKTLV